MRESKIWTFLESKPEIEYNLEGKKKFRQLGRAYLKSVVNRLEDVKESDVRFNPGGVAVSGDHSLYVMFSNDKGACMFFSSGLICDFVTFRTISHMKDFTGGNNNNKNMKILADPDEAANLLMRLGGVI